MKKCGVDNNKNPQFCIDRLGTWIIEILNVLKKYNNGIACIDRNSLINSLSRLEKEKWISF